MTERADPAGVEAPSDELVGRTRLVRNVMSGWATLGVLIVSGFVTPRLIDMQLGSELLGIWDFGWALTAYATVLPGGSATSVNRYVAWLRAVGDEGSINRAVSSISVVLGGIAILILVLAAGVVWQLPSVFGSQLGPHLADARWVVALLAAGIAVDIGMAGFGGVLSGSHRYDLFHGIEGARGALTAVGYVAVLLLGGGLRELAAVTLAGTLLSRFARATAAKWIFPPLEIRFRHADRATAIEMVRFGGKAFAPQLGDLLLWQTTTLFIMASLGPAGVAVFARTRALVRHARMLVNRYAMVIIPTASALHAMGRRDELQRELIESTRRGLFITLPLILLFAILGGQLLRAWMGPSYEQAALLALLSGGYFFLMAMQPAMSILTGMNSHGRPGAARLLAAIVAIIGVALVLGPFGGGLTAVGVALAVPIVAVDGLYVPLYACRQLEIPLSRLIRDAAGRPLLCALPIAISFGIARAAYADREWLALGTGATGAILLAGPLYWRYAIRDG